jgi:hypothetical protein
MTVSQLLDGAYKRVPWTIMRPLLKTCELPTGRGWEDSKDKLQKISTEAKYVDSFLQLKSLYCDHTLVGEKVVKFFRPGELRVNNLANLLSSYKVKLSDYDLIYPFPLSDEKLRSLNSTPQLVEIKDSSENLVLVFCSSRSTILRTKIHPSSFESEARRSLEEYEEIVGTKKINHQFFDSIILWKNKNLVEVRVDFLFDILPCEREIAFIETIKSFNLLAKSLTGVDTFLRECINFFPLIKILYESSEGKVGDIAFTTDEGSTKFEKMRRGAIDLRHETYHQAGRSAVDQIHPYRLGVLWDFEISEGIKSSPELLLAAQSRTLSAQTQVLNEVIIRKCCCLTDYQFVLDKIIDYLDSRD